MTILIFLVLSCQVIMLENRQKLRVAKYTFLSVTQIYLFRSERLRTHKNCCAQNPRSARRLVPRDSNE